MLLNKVNNINPLPNLGIIAGGGLLPSEIARLQRNIGGKVFIAALEGEAEISSIAIYSYKQFPIGSVGELLKYFTESNVEEIIIIGGIKRPDLKSIKVDVIGSLLIAKILKEKFLGDDNILKIISNFIESKGFKVISPKKLLELNNFDAFHETKSKPSKQDKIDIELGIKTLNALSDFDIGQSVIVSDGYVLGIEAAEGTDNLIKRCALLRRNKKAGVLIKMAKSSQDMRLDIPTIGPDTISYLAIHGYNGLAIENTKLLIVKSAETIKLINKSNLFITLV